jgi:hypothetical protein
LTDEKLSNYGASRLEKIFFGRQLRKLG